MLSLPAPEGAHIQQMHIAAFFWLRSFMLLCYIDGPALTTVLVGSVGSRLRPSTLPGLPQDPCQVLV
jgi:hypothetical protein